MSNQPRCPSGNWIGELPEEDQLIVDHHGDQAGGTLARPVRARGGLRLRLSGNKEELYWGSIESSPGHGR